MSAVEIAPDCEAERQFLPEPSTLKHRLLLADRGYPSTKYFEAVRENGGSFIVRLSRSHDPWVRAAWVDGSRVTSKKPVRLSRFIAQNPGRQMDLDVEYDRTEYTFRVVVVFPRSQDTRVHGNRWVRACKVRTLTRRSRSVLRVFRRGAPSASAS